jgi:hypothetical protein
MEYSLFYEYVSNVDALQSERTSVIEMQTIFHTVHTSVAERSASKFVTLKTKHLVTHAGRWL